MRFYLNEVSLQGQFEPEPLELALKAILSARQQADALVGMRVSHTIKDRPACGTRSLREIAREWQGTDFFRSLMAWLGKLGPFVEEDRLEEPDDYFECLGVDVTNGALGEATRRAKASQDSTSISFRGGTVSFEGNPLSVTHGLREEPLGNYDIRNFVDLNEAVAFAQEQESLPASWQELVERARMRCPKLVIPNSVYENPSLAREPFGGVIRDRVLVLLGILQAYMDGRTDGIEGAKAKAIINDFFHGDRALFSAESPTNQEEFKAELTFPDPLHAGQTVFAHWHGKISHRYFRVHFAWPLIGTDELLKVVYIGPKLTKS